MPAPSPERERAGPAGVPVACASGGSGQPAGGQAAALLEKVPVELRRHPVLLSGGMQQRVDWPGP